MGLVASGCGLVWSFEPPKDEVDASATDAGHRDGGHTDAGRRDAGSAGRDGGANDSGPDGGPTRLDGDIVEPVDGGFDAATDADGPDAGISSAPICEEICPASSFCDRPEGRCVGPASCVPRVDESCSAVEDPVCGCDRNTYRNPCAARNAGVSILTRGECPDFGAYDWCDPGPAVPPSPSGCSRCFDDADCPSFFPLCIGSACGVAGDGVCAAYAGPGTCYYDYECPAEQRCVGALVHGCRADGQLPSQGSCEFP